MKKLSILLIFFVLASSLCISQEQYGNIRGIAVDEEGTPLPGVSVTLESELYALRSSPITCSSR